MTETPVTQATYDRLRTFAKSFNRNHFLGHVDVDDYVQEAALATWRGRKKPRSAMVDHFRTRAPLTRRDYARADLEVPVFCALEDWYEELVCEPDMESLLDMAELYRVANTMPRTAWSHEFPDIDQQTVINFLEEVRSCLNPSTEDL